MKACKAWVVLAVLAVAACDDSTGPEEREIPLGGLFSLTGNWSSLGLASKVAMDLAIADVNARLAGTGLQFRGEIADTRLEPATTLAQVQDLRGKGVQIFIGPQSSAEVAVLKPFADTADILIISQSSTAGTLAIAGDNILRLTPADSLEGVAVSGLMWADGIRAVVPVWRADAGNQGLQRAVRGRYPQLGGTVSVGTEYATNATSYAATVAALHTQVQAAVALQGTARVGVYLAAFDEVVELFQAAAGDSLLASVRWYGSDGVALTEALRVSSVASAFAARVGYPNPIPGLATSASERWAPILARIKAVTGVDPDAFALGVYDAVWLAAQAYLASPAEAGTDVLRERFVAAAEGYFGATGWTALNAAGDRRFGDFDFWAMRRDAGGARWVRVAKFDTQTGTLTRE